MTSINDQKSFYDAESSVYSRKRYEGELISYSQYLFRKRRTINLGYLQSILREMRPVSVFEIGCADGVLFKSISAQFPHVITKMVGVDVSLGMIEAAREKSGIANASYELRGEETQESFDIVLELGVHVENLESEISYIQSRLNKGGYVIFSYAGKDSIHARVKIPNAPYVKDYETYSTVEKILTSHFEIIEARSYGLFVPKLWSFPRLARILQPLFDTLARPFVSELFHEKIYLLKDKR